MRMNLLSSHLFIPLHNLYGFDVVQDSDFLTRSSQKFEYVTVSNLT